MTVFVTWLGGSPVAVGMVSVLATAGAASQLLAAYFSDPRPRTLRFVFWSYTLACAFWLPLAALVAAGNRSLGLLLALYGLFRVMALFCSAPYQSLIARTLAPEQLGRGYGAIFGIKMTGGIAGALLAAWWMHAPLPAAARYAGCFAVMFLLTNLGNLLMLGVRERPKEPHAAPRLGDYLRRVAADVRADPAFCRYLFARALLTADSLLVYFHVVQSGASEAAAPLLGGALMAGMGTGTFFWGTVGDRRGYRTVALAGAGVLLADIALMGLAGTTRAIYAIAALCGFYLAAVQVSAFGIAVRLCPRPDATSYFGALWTVLAPFNIAVPLLGGKLIEVAGYPPVLGFAAVCTVAGMALLWNLRLDAKRGPST
jgi:MFS family permease